MPIESTIHTNHEGRAHNHNNSGTASSNNNITSSSLDFTFSGHRRTPSPESPFVLTTGDCLLESCFDYSEDDFACQQVVLDAIMEQIDSAAGNNATDGEEVVLPNAAQETPSTRIDNNVSGAGWMDSASSILEQALFVAGAYFVISRVVSLPFYQWTCPSSQQPCRWLSWCQMLLSASLAIGACRLMRQYRRPSLDSGNGIQELVRQQPREIEGKPLQTSPLARRIQLARRKRVLRALEIADRQFARIHQQQLQDFQDLSSRGSMLNGDVDGSYIPPMQPEKQTLLSISESQSSSSSEDKPLRVDDSSRRFYDATTISLSGMSALSGSHSFKPIYSGKSFYDDHECSLGEEISVIPYAHGGFFAAAPFMLLDPHWISILRLLMPDVYVEIGRRVGMTPPSRLIHWAENNPVVAAYGASRVLLQDNSINSLSSQTQPRQIPNLEWDVFLDPYLVRQVQLIVDHQNALQQRGEQSSQEIIQGIPIEIFYQQELERRAQELVDNMLIAHGNVTQLIAEQVNAGKAFNFSRVKRTRRTLGGGMQARQWMAVFSEALRLGICGDDCHTINSFSVKSNESDRTESGSFASLLALAASSYPKTTLSESVEIVERITNSKRPVGLVLDIKSRHIPQHIWAIVVDTLRATGIRIEGVASFCIEEIRDLSRYATLGPIPELVFCHSAGNLQRACHDGKIKYGDKVFFNAGSLLTGSSVTNWDRLCVYSLDPKVIQEGYQIEACGLPRSNGGASCLQDYKEAFGLSIGLYCQEFAIDKAAVQLLVRLVNEHPSIYDLGFSWGGINGTTVQGIVPGRFTKTDGYWSQRLAGRSWDYRLFPLTKLLPSEKKIT